MISQKVSAEIAEEMRLYPLNTKNMALPNVRNIIQALSDNMLDPDKTRDDLVGIASVAIGWLQHMDAENFNWLDSIDYINSGAGSPNHVTVGFIDELTWVCSCGEFNGSIPNLRKNEDARPVAE